MEVHYLLIGYVVLMILGLAYFFWRRPRRGMILKMTGKTSLAEPVQKARILNVVFNYNGHSWDAYEVLGIPAGSPMDSVKKAYDAACVKVDTESRPFLDAALNAIAHHTQN